MNRNVNLMMNSEYTMDEKIDGKNNLTLKLFTKIQQKQKFMNKIPSEEPFRKDNFIMSSENTGKELEVISGKVKILREILQKSNLFNREDEEINELSSFINRKITQCQQEVQGYQEESSKHRLPALSQAICHILEGKIITLTNTFKKLLQMRTQHLKQFEAKKQDIYSSQQEAKKEQQITKRKKIDYTRRNIFLNKNENDGDRDGQVNIDMGQSEVQVNRRDQRNRNQSMRQIESLLTEIGGVFQKLGSIVQHHEVMIDRIDKNTEDTRFLIDKGKKSLTNTYDQVSSNRTLIIKVLLILFVFSFVYITFLL